MKNILAVGLNGPGQIEQAQLQQTILNFSPKSREIWRHIFTIKN